MHISDTEFKQQWKKRFEDHHNFFTLYNCALAGKDGIIQNSRHVVCIHNSKIKSITRFDPDDTMSLAHYVIDPYAINCQGRLVMPGFCDAHVHVTADTADLPAMLSAPESLTTARATHILRDMLFRGFTTVRDCGGADWGLAAAVEEGTVLGPRILFTGHALSQTGGHGDMRGKGEDCFACGAALRGIGRVCDGDTEVRRAARDELRKGAHCIKIMASGGVSSPTDRLTNTQFSLDEMKAIVEEAQAAGTYVCAHAYTPESMRRALACGVRSIEHGNFLDTTTASEMAAAGAFLVPTLVTYLALKCAGETAGMKPELVAKVGDLYERGLQSLEIARTHGVRMCFGSDLLGELHSCQLQEFKILAQVLPTLEVIATATENCAALFRMDDRIGKVAVGYLADLLVVNGNPYQDITALKEERLMLIMKEGVVVKNALRGLSL